ncbi:MAG: chemotaxis response regulator protein-glutamate methylesterase [Zetaproteobacteria bacterium]|nr:chemotaxis response regulator protein-glutamate methylesterase [Zetaproteobacteria bacterium]
MPVKVLIIDDSAMVRTLLTKILNQHPDITVVGSAPDPLVAKERIKLLKPDVLTLDVDMPRMDGIEFLEKLMRINPMPVVMVSSLTQKGAAVTLKALELGAFDFVHKPTDNLRNNLELYSDEITGKVLGAAASRLARKPQSEPAKARVLTGSVSVTPKVHVDEVIRKTSAPNPINPQRIVAIGSSTGGIEALKEVCTRFPKNLPAAVVITQHIPEPFPFAMAKRMNSICEMEIQVAEDQQELKNGNIYIAPGDRHLMINVKNGKYICHLSDETPVNRHKPSVDVLFRSVNQAAGRNVTGVILTGMGEDGALCLKEIREAGGYTIGQDEESSVVWGMPGAAWKSGAVMEKLSLLKISDAIIKHLSANTRGY